MLNYVVRHPPKTLSNDQLRDRIGTYAGIAAIVAGIAGLGVLLFL